MTTPFAQELQVAIEAVRLAAAFCRTVQPDQSAALQKADQSPVTVADFGSQALVCRTLARHFPEDAVLSEERSNVLLTTGGQTAVSEILRRFERLNVSAASSKELCQWIDHGQTAVSTATRCWILDPLDGTKGFLRGKQYAIALALAVRGRVQLSVLACPNLGWEQWDRPPYGTLLYAVAGQGCFAGPLAASTQEAIPVRVSSRQVPQQARVCQSFESAHTNQKQTDAVWRRLGLHQQPLRLDSQAKYALVARGEAEIYLRISPSTSRPEKAWDHAAGSLLVTEAGGNVTDINGRPLDFTCGDQLTNNRGVLATNGLLHSSVLQALQQDGQASA